MSVNCDSPRLCGSVRTLIDPELRRDVRMGSHGESKETHDNVAMSSTRHRPTARDRRSAEGSREWTTDVPNAHPSAANWDRLA